MGGGMDRSVKWLVGAQVVLLGLLLGGGYFVYQRITVQDEVLQELQRKLESLGAKIEQAHLTVCNLSLSSVRWSAAVRVSADRARLRSGYLGSGECERRTVYHRPGFGEIYVHGHSSGHDEVAIAANKTVNAFFGSALAEDDRVVLEESWDTVYFHGTADVIYCSTVEEGLRGRPFVNDETCENGRLFGYGLAARSGKDSRDWAYGFENPNWPLLQGSAAAPLEGVELAQLQLKAMRAAVERQMQEAEELGGRTIVGYLGAKIVDSNSALSPGIEIETAMAQDIFGEAQKIRAGDTILAVNGKPVFAVIDLEAEIQRHAMDIKRGVNKALSVKIVGDTCPDTCTVPVYYFFNEAYSGQASQEEAMAWGVSNAFLYGQATWVSCIGSELGKLAVNIFGALYEGFNAAREKREPDMGKAELMKPRTAEEIDLCIWENEQRSALSRQTQEQYFSQAEMLGIMLPTGVGSYLSRPLLRKFGGGVIKRGAGRALASAVMAEVVETSLWSFSAGPPGLSLHDRIKSVRSDLPYAVGFGVAGGTLMSAQASKAKYKRPQ